MIKKDEVAMNYTLLIDIVSYRNQSKIRNRGLTLDEQFEVINSLKKDLFGFAEENLNSSLKKNPM